MDLKDAVSCYGCQSFLIGAGHGTLCTKCKQKKLDLLKNDFPEFAKSVKVTETFEFMFGEPAPDAAD